MRKLIPIILLTLLGVVGVEAQVAVTVGTKVTDASSLVSGKAYVIKYTSMTGTPYIYDAGTTTPLQAPSVQNAATKACAFYFISDGNGAYKLQNAYTGCYWPAPTGNERLYPTTAANAGSWEVSISDGTATLTCTNGGTTYGLDRLTPDVVGWSSRKTVEIYEVSAADLSTTAVFTEFTDKDINVSATAATSLTTGTWYVMKNIGRNVYAYEKTDAHKLYNQSAAPSGSAADNAKFLVRLLNGSDGKYYIQNGLGNSFGAIPQNTAVPTTALIEEQISISQIGDNAGYYFLRGTTDSRILDCQDPGYPVVGWGTDAPGATNSNASWQFFPIEFVESWVPAIDEVYTINNTNAYRGALIFNSENPKYVWSSGKGGTFDATNANSQWVIIPSGTANQYFLYNVGAGKFAIPSGIANGAGSPWIFSDNAVAVIFETQGNGTKKIKMANNPVSGTNAAYLSVSNGQTYPIINYNDEGSEFTITKVDGDASTAASTAASAAVAKLVKNQTALTGAVTADDGWYIISIKTTSNSTATASPGRYIYPGTTNQANYPLTFTGGVDVQPSISDATFYTRFVKNGSDYNWQMTDGRYLINRSNVFPTASSEPTAVIPGYDNGNYIYSSGRYADPYVSNGNFFIGETASYRTTWNIYPIDLTAAGLTAWQVLCDNAPETAEITCSRTDVCGLTAVYKNGFFFLPTGVTPAESDFTLDGASGVTIDGTAHTITFTYDPNLAIVADGVIVEQGWQTAGRDSEVMLLRVTAAPFKDATNATMTVSLKDGSEANISTLKLYEANSSSPEIYSTGNGAPTKTEVATATISGATATFNIGNLAAGTHYYWIGATVKGEATLGAIIDAAVTGITYTCNDNVTNLDLTSVGNPSDRGAMVFNTQSYPYLPRDNGSRVYRIPAMVVADDGSIVVACDKRYDSHTDIGAGHVIDIVIRRSTDGGKTWSNPTVIAKGLGSADNDKCGYGDPSLVKGKDGKIYCLFVAGNLGYFYGQKHIAMSTSTDNGVTWSSNESTPPVDLFSTGALKNYNTVGAAGHGLYDYFVTSGRGLYIPEDDILMYLIPAQTMTSTTEHTGDSQDYIFYSRDGGESWYFSETPMVQGGDEAKIIQMNDGSLFGSIRKGGPRRFNTATYSCNDDGKTLSFNFGTQWDNSQLSQASQNNQDIFYYQRETETGKTDVIIHSITTGNHANFKLFYSTDKGANWTEFLNVQTKGTRYVTMERSGSEDNPGSLYLFFEDQSLNSAGGYTDYNHYPLNFLEITREQLESLIPTLNDYANINPVEGVKVVYGMTGHTTYGTLSGLTWTSKVTSDIATGDNTIAGLTMVASDGAFNQFSSWNGHFNLAYHPAANNTPATLTLTAPAGYAIESYSMLLARASSATHTYTVASESGTSVDVPFGSNASSYATLEETGINAKSTAITVTTSDVSKWLAIADFVVNLKRAVEYKVVDGNGNEWASQTVIFDTNSVVDEMPQSLKRAFCTYSYYSDAECTTAVTNIDDLATIYVKCAYAGPFEFSTKDNPKWYFMYAHKQNDENDYLAYADGSTYGVTAKAFINKYSDAAYHWAFIGNPYAVKVMNRSNNGYLATSTLPTTNNKALDETAVSSDESAYPYNTFSLYGFSNQYIVADNPFHLSLNAQAGVFVNGGNGNLFYHNAVIPDGELKVTNWKDAYVMAKEVPTTYPVALNAVGEASYATLYLPFDVTTDDNTRAYYIETVADGVATLTELSEGKIPAKTAVVLINDGAETEAVFSVASGLTEAISEDNNLLKGTLVPMELDLGQNTPYYSMGRKDGKIGFYKFDNNGTTTITLGANKAYLEVPNSGGAKGFIFSFGDPSGIEAIGSSQISENAAIYDLSGRRISTSKLLNGSVLPKGIYIMNGKKVVIR